MYKVIIADEDLDNVKNFKTYIGMNFKEFKIVKILINYSTKISDIIRNNKPNLIIGDIRFFGKNPYKNLKDIYKDFPDINFLLYGSLNDTDYLNKTLEIGTINYMIKPIRPSDLGRSLGLVKDKLEKNRIKKEEYEKIYSQYKKNIDIFKNYFIFDLLKGVVNDNEEILNSFNYFNIILEIPYVTIIFNISEFEKYLLILDEEEKHLLIYKLFYTVKNILDNNITNICKINSFDSIVVILGGSVHINDIIKYCENIKGELKRKYEIEISVGIGRVYNNPSDISTSYKEAQCALKHKFYMGKNSIIPIDYVEPNNIISFKYQKEKEKDLIYRVVIGDLESSKALIDELFKILRELSFIPNGLLSQIIINILTSIGRRVVEQNILINFDISSFFKIQDVMKIKLIDESYLYLYSTIEKICNYIIDERKRFDLIILDKVKTHIRETYYEQISLNNAAANVGTAPGYLNNLFLTYENKSYFDYVVGIRLDIAKKLLSETDLSDDMIAVNIGYDDGRYFRSIFKQYENINTEDFRLKNYK